MRWLPLAMIALFARNAHATKRPRFEPTDLEVESPGTAEVDLQFGPIRGTDAWRVVAPDFELDLGILDNLELDLDGAYAVEGTSYGTPGPKLLDHSSPDNLWPSVRTSIKDWKSLGGSSLGLGVQVGPKLPVARDAHRIGVEGLFLIGIASKGTHVILNLGGLVDPRTGTSPRPSGVEGGLDLEVELVPNKWSFLGELGGIAFTSPDPDQLAATAGIQWSPNERLDLSVVTLVGLASGSDSYALLLGASPKFSIW